MSEDDDRKLLDRWIGVLHRHDPEIADVVAEIPAATYERQRLLDTRTKELVTIVMLTALKGSGAAIRHHVRQAIDCGATKEEILEAIELVITPAGLPAFEHGLLAWADALDEKGLEVDAKYTKLP